MDSTFFSLMIFCYAVASLKHFLYLGLKKEILFYIAIASVVLGFIFHTTALVLRSKATGHGPYNSIYEYTNFFSWAIILVYLIAEFKYKIREMGAFIIPIALILSAVAASFLDKDLPNAYSSPILKFWLSAHITLSFTGISAFALTFGVGIMYLIQEKQLKSKRPGRFYHRMPSLEVLDNMNHRVIDIGYPLFTLGIICGAVWASQAKGALFLWDPKRTLPLLITWSIYTILFIGRIIAGWRGKKAASIAIIGFMTAIITYLIHTI